MHLHPGYSLLVYYTLHRRLERDENIAIFERTRRKTDTAVLLCTQVLYLIRYILEYTSIRVYEYYTS